VLVKCHPGSTNNWFIFYLNDPGDLKIVLPKRGLFNAVQAPLILQDGPTCEA